MLKQTECVGCLLSHSFQEGIQMNTLYWTQTQFTETVVTFNTHFDRLNQNKYVT